MSEERYDIYLSGHLLPEADRQQTVERLAALFRVEFDKAGRLLDGRPHRIKQGTDRDTAQQYLQRLKRAGAEAAVKAVAAGGDRTESSDEESFDLAPPGTPVLREEERRDYQAVDIDISHLDLAPAGTEILEGHERPAPPPPPQTDHISLQDDER